MNRFTGLARFFLSLFILLLIGFPAFSFSSSPVNLIPVSGKKESGGQSISKKTFESPDDTYNIKLGAIKKGNSILVQGIIGKEPEKSTFEQIFLQDKQGHRIYPAKVSS